MAPVATLDSMRVVIVPAAHSNACCGSAPCGLWLASAPPAGGAGHGRRRRHGASIPAPATVQTMRWRTAAASYRGRPHALWHRLAGSCALGARGGRGGIITQVPPRKMLGVYV